MFFRKKDSLKNQANKIDKLVTGLIIGWAIASMLGLSKTNKWKEIQDNITTEWSKIAKKWYSIFWRVLVKIISIFSKKEK